ncbi:cytochrome o ubiquinol oxidase, subunit III [Buchnera aphidicola (Nipponaphis monzeni)]|uniref:Cytochrome bo(3) ubiquinol oxidase subunit 3 n=1 Tax=Buchnera aphidicola (Nipponaphis monzeni) TaxID=2495405 RepID=A0A455TAK7_9GAMM|nr:cytochrome c oxidase subunit 3 [Buchnera aphidicola]BBI01358.1 cytochrome o ubiquinol oxidase, subunit III [Buchnera aphidicola (Nipponaphis monzeni)]
MLFDKTFKKKVCIKNNQLIDSKKILGFWIYLMSDCIIFGILFATFFVMKNSIFGKFISRDIFNLNIITIETIVLLLSSMCYGMISYTNKNYCNYNLKLLLCTFFLGVIFVCIELNEFHNLYINNFTPSTNSFFSAYYTLLSTHCIHVIIGLIWIIITICKSCYPLTKGMRTNYICLGLFWHFIDIIWICIFNFVYLVGIFL